MKNIHSLSCDHNNKRLFWGNAADGKTHGAINRAPYLGTSDNVTSSKDYESANSISYDPLAEISYFITNNTDVYAYNETDGTSTLISEGFFTNATSLQAIDNFIYVIDANKGLYVIKAFYSGDEVMHSDPI
jgi:hypothetical protein